ncbi:MAG: TIGR02757 family protein [Spirochaetales bacterium]|nr:TIGR02757 family protein [Spirochaetales bacterium]
MTESTKPLSTGQAGTILEGFYRKYHKPEYINPDPLIFPRRYELPLDIEAAAFIASSFALGRVNQIISFLESLFGRLGSPLDGLCRRSEKEIAGDFRDFKYRFYSPDDISRFLIGLRRIYIENGSIENCFKTKAKAIRDLGQDYIIAGLSGIAEAINDGRDLTETGIGPGHRNVVPNPGGGSACKRMNLFLRWVVRKDCIDPGMWELDPGLLLVPLDTHVMRVSSFLGLTERKIADMKTVKQITSNLKLIDKADPVKYDFSMSRIGIHPDLSYSELEKEILL